MTNEETFQIRIAPAIPGLAAMSDLDAFRAICQFCHMYCDLTTTVDYLLTVSGGTLDLGANMDMFERNEGGVWCSGMALMCAQMLNASTRVDKAWYSEEGIPVFTHATTLATVRGVLYQYDPYFNGEYVDDQGEIMPYLKVLRAIKSRTPPRWRQHFAEKDIHAESFGSLKVWNDNMMDPVQFRLKRKLPSSEHGIGRGLVTAKAFWSNYFEKHLVKQALIDLGYPAKPTSQLWHYIRLHPIAVGNANYGDPDTSYLRVFSSIHSAL